MKSFFYLLFLSLKNFFPLTNNLKKFSRSLYYTKSSSRIIFQFMRCCVCLKPKYFSKVFPFFAVIINFRFGYHRNFFFQHLHSFSDSNTSKSSRRKLFLVFVKLIKIRNTKAFFTTGKFLFPIFQKFDLQRNFFPFSF